MNDSRRFSGAAAGLGGTASVDAEAGATEEDEAMLGDWETEVEAKSRLFLRMDKEDTRYESAG